MDKIREMIKISFATKNQQAFAIDGTSCSGLEAGLFVLIEPSDKVLVPAYGRSTYLLDEIYEHARAGIIYLEKDWLASFERTTVVGTIEEYQPKIVAVVHDETVNAQIQPLDRINTFCRENETFFIVDMVATYGGVETEVDGWRVDIAVVSTQKYVGVPSDLSLTTYSQCVAGYLADCYQKELGLDVDTRNGRFIQSNYLDLSRLGEYRGPEHLNHHTEVTTTICGPYEGLHLLLQEGMENVCAHHWENNRVLAGNLQKMGLEIFGKLDTETLTIIPVVIPGRVDDKKMWSLLLDHFKAEIASSFGDLKEKVWQADNMGYSSHEDNVLHFLSVFGAMLKHQGYRFEGGSGSTCALAEYLN